MPHATWRAFIIVAALPVFATLSLAWWLLPESPRYLIGKGQYHAAAKSLRRCVFGVCASSGAGAVAVLASLLCTHPHINKQTTA